MYKAYGVIKTLAPLHVGATAGEETGNLNLIFRDQFTQTGIIPGSSIRGRFRADLRDRQRGQEQIWYGHESVEGRPDGGTTEALVKFEYASLVWFPVFCPGQPVVWVTCPELLKRFQRIAKITADIPEPYTAAPGLQGRPIEKGRKVLFFNLGFLEIEHDQDLSPWIPIETNLNPNKLVVVDDNDISMLHDMTLYRQSRVKLLDDMKKVDTERGAFFNTEALPEGSILVFPIGLKRKGWQPFDENDNSSELYFGGLESIGFGRCLVSLAGDYQ
ncbi:MAG: RAMP superfamily CRISPR-associated protein [Lyngbya sp.]|nr:RAMP superfamily CRISPR-associated protein [Lyngbya sp.]